MSFILICIFIIIAIIAIILTKKIYGSGKFEIYNHKKYKFLHYIYISNDNLIPYSRKTSVYNTNGYIYADGGAPVVYLIRPETLHLHKPEVCITESNQQIPKFENISFISGIKFITYIIDVITNQCIGYSISISLNKKYPDTIILNEYYILPTYGKEQLQSLLYNHFNTSINITLPNTNGIIINKIHGKNMQTFDCFPDVYNELGFTNLYKIRGTGPGLVIVPGIFISVLAFVFKQEPDDLEILLHTIGMDDFERHVLHD